MGGAGGDGDPGHDGGEVGLRDAGVVINGANAQLNGPGEGAGLQVDRRLARGYVINGEGTRNASGEGCGAGGDTVTQLLATPGPGEELYDQVKGCAVIGGARSRGTSPQGEGTGFIVELNVNGGVVGLADAAHADVYVGDIQGGIGGDTATDKAGTKVYGGRNARIFGEGQIDLACC